MIIGIERIHKRNVRRHEIQRVLRNRCWHQAEVIQDDIRGVKGAHERKAGYCCAERGELADDVEVLFDEVGVGWLGVVGVVEEVAAAGLEL